MPYSTHRSRLSRNEHTWLLDRFLGAARLPEICAFESSGHCLFVPVTEARLLSMPRTWQSTMVGTDYPTLFSKKEENNIGISPSLV